MENQRNILRSEIWALDQTITFDKIKELFKLNYTEPIKYLTGEEYDSYSTEDRNLYNSWKILKDVQQFELNDEGNTNVSFISTQGIMEGTYSSSKAHIDEAKALLLSRDKRVYSTEAGVIFVDISSRIYAIVYGTTAAFGVKSILMGAGNGARKKPEWGKINTKPIQFNPESDFYYWLFEKQRTNPHILTAYGEYEIRDVEGIGRFSDRKQHDTKGKGPKSTQELSNKTALGISQLVYQSDFNIVTSDIDSYISLGVQCITDTGRSLYTDSLGARTVNTDIETFLLNLYTKMIPGLVSAYNAEISANVWTPSQAIISKRKWALEVIEELSQFHSLTIDELSMLPYFKVKSPSL